MPPMKDIHFYTDPEDQKFMTRAEVVKGVNAIKEVAERYLSEFRIERMTETEIVVEGRLENLAQSFRFQPTEFTAGAFKGMFFLREYNSCQTNYPHEDASVKEMLDALMAAVNNKLCVNG